MEATGKSSTIHVLHEFQPFLRIFIAFNRNKVRSTNYRDHLHHAFSAFSTVMLVIETPICIILSIWYQISKDVDMKGLIAVLPVLITLLQIELILVALMLKHRSIVDTIARVQKVVDQRKKVGLSSLFESLKDKNTQDFHQFRTLRVSTIALCIPTCGEESCNDNYYYV